MRETLIQYQDLWCCFFVQVGNWLSGLDKNYEMMKKKCFDFTRFKYVFCQPPFADSFADLKSDIISCFMKIPSAHFGRRKFLIVLIQFLKIVHIKNRRNFYSLFDYLPFGRTSILFFLSLLFQDFFVSAKQSVP